MTVSSPSSPAARTATGWLRARDVADLTTVSGYPCVSLLLPTEPAAQMTGRDVATLAGLAATVEAELREHLPAGARKVRERFDELVREAALGPTDRGLALFVNQATARLYRLPEPPTPRALVERTFATRDLVNALHRTPPYALLVIHPSSAHLLHAIDGTLRTIAIHDLFGRRRPVRLPRQGDPGHHTQQVERDLLDGYLRDVDRMLGAYRADHPSPLVLAGDPELVGGFRALSRHLERLAGVLAPEAVHHPLDLARAGSATLERYLRSRREEALRTLRTELDKNPDRVACGVAACWNRVHTSRPLMLLVEHDYVAPGPPDTTARPSLTHPDAAHLPAVHDLIDDLIEQVMVRGGQLALVDPGDLADQHRVALLLNPT